MPKRTVGRQPFAESYLAQRLKIEREKRGWTFARLEHMTEQAGCKVSASSLWKIENPTDPEKPRRITVDELVVLSKVFDLPMVELVSDPELALPEHLAALAERIVLVDHARWVAHQQHEDAEREYGELMRDLVMGMSGNKARAKRVLQRFEAASAPDWVAEDDVVRRMRAQVRDTIEAVANDGQHSEA